MHASSDHRSQRPFDIVERVNQQSDRLEVVFADRAYRGELEDEYAETLGLWLEIVESESYGLGFIVEPKRWIAERTFSWLGGWRGLSRAYERPTKTSALQLALNRHN